MSSNAVLQEAEYAKAIPAAVSLALSSRPGFVDAIRSAEACTRKE